METWKPIDGTNGACEVSDFGRIRSYRKKNGKPCDSPRIVEPHRNREGYCMVNINKKATVVHRLVAYAFLGPRPPGLEICHNDDNKENNSASNLRYDTHEANLRDRDRNNKTVRGEKSGRAILSLEKVKEIASLVASGASKYAIAKRYSVTTGAIYGIAKGHTWSWATGIPDQRKQKASH